MNKENKPVLILIFIALILFVTTSCTYNKENEKVTVGQYRSIVNITELSKDSENSNTRVKEYTYEGCQYIVVDVGYTRWGSHKGNCKNKIHKQ